MKRDAFPIVAVRSFIEATRDTGYKSTGAAIAELVDNSFEATASTVDVRIEEIEAQGTKGLTVRVTDDGTGMTPDVLRLALQFGGSTRFDSRTAAGRYGMGLPNGSLSQARRVEVFTWTRPSQVWRSYLDVDEIASGQLLEVPPPRTFDPPSLLAKTNSGTVVTLTKCDRLDYRRIRTLEEKLSLELGRVFRKFIYAGKRLLLNGQAIRPLDPLFLQAGQNLTGAEPFGPPLQYRVRIPATTDAVSTAVVRFSELPIEQWHEFSNDEKNRSRIAKHAGVSIVRANREIDYGWYFMGGKRKENYDDWWRCEVSFMPDLDELFGVTHSKQKINPTEALSAILVPEMERTARELNSRVRRKYASIRREAPGSKSIRKLEARDYLLEPPTHLHRNQEKEVVLCRSLRTHNGGIGGLRFRVAHRTSPGNSFYEPALKHGRLDLVLNESHPFFTSVYRPLEASTLHMERATLDHVLTLLFAGARAECSLGDTKQRKIIHRFREHWSDTLAAFLS
ncbi:MAG TPA: ATP-binding protein [Candidatus Polarisedimenticolia bacterium]|nr:ATP-binding protein [Candidatus Polarisedimenticolia bacterium]